MSKPVFIIAEMSANHCGDFELAKKIIAAAKDAGADAVKIQTYTADTITIDSKRDEFLIKGDGNLWKDRYLYELYQEASTPWEWQPRLKEYADSIAIPFFSTPFDNSAVDFLEKMNVPMYKIASFEAYDYPLIRYAAKCGKPMIISTGISTLEEMQGAIDACKGVGNNDITLLKCTSSYPAKLSEMNLLTITDMIERFAPQGVKIGLSDHSMQNITARLLQFVRINRQGLHVTVANSFFRCQTRFALIECAIGIYTLIAILEQRMTQNIIRVIMTVVPNQRNGLSIVVLERILTNGSTIGAQNVVSRGPTTKIVFLHFDFSSFYGIIDVMYP